MGLFNDFVVQFDDGLSEYLEHGGAPLRQVIVAAAAFSLPNGGLRAEPPIPLEALQQGVERSGTDVVAVVSQLREHPLADERALSGVVEDVDFPEAQQDFARQQLGVEAGHRADFYITPIVNENYSGR